jgi:signal peptidase II
VSGLRLELLIAAVVVAIDQATKAAVRSSFALYDSVTVVSGFFDLTRVHNFGAAFGFMNTAEFPFKDVVLAGVAAVALVGLAIYGAALPPDQRLGRVGLALIIGGAAGNLIDRITAGYVLDFFDFYWAGWHFWAFNVADAAITVGVSLMILDLLGIGRNRVSRTV